MKEAMLVACRNGFLLNKLFNRKRNYPIINATVSNNMIYFWADNTRPTQKYTPDFLTYNFYQLIFATDFVDKLVGEGTCQKKKKVSLHKMPDCKENLIGRAGYMSSCKGCDYWQGPAYHLRQMSTPEISRDIEKLKEYVRGLV